MDKRPDEVATMFDDVAPKYDVVNDVLSMGQTRRWRKVVVEAMDVKPGQRVLDLAAGTGTSSEPYADAGIDVVACDFSLGMLKVGKRRRPDIDFIAGDATSLPFADNTFDASTISFGLRNVNEPKKALAEMLRVTKPGGKLVIAEFSQPVVPLWRTMYTEYLMRALPAIAVKVSSNPDAYVYLAESIRAWPDQDHLAAWLQEAGWDNVTYRNLSGGIVAVHRAVKPGSRPAPPAGAAALAAHTGPVAKLRRNIPARALVHRCRESTDRRSGSGRVHCRLLPGQGRHRRHGAGKDQLPARKGLRRRAHPARRPRDPEARPAAPRSGRLAPQQGPAPAGRRPQHRTALARGLRLPAVRPDPHPARLRRGTGPARPGPRAPSCWNATASPRRCAPTTAA